MAFEAAASLEPCLSERLRHAIPMLLVTNVQRPSAINELLEAVRNLVFPSAPAPCPRTNGAQRMKRTTCCVLTSPPRVSPESCFECPALLSVLLHASHMSSPAPFCLQVIGDPAIDACRFCRLYGLAGGSTNPRNKSIANQRMLAESASTTCYDESSPSALLEPNNKNDRPKTKSTEATNIGSGRPPQTKCPPKAPVI